MQQTGRTALEHGGRREAFRRRFPDAPTPLLDLSTGINPVPYKVDQLPASVWSRLPEPDDLAALEAIAALTYGVRGPAMVVAAPGTQILISLLPHLMPRRDVRVLGPTYGEHLGAWRNAGIAAREVRDVADLRGAGCAVLCQPNNPDGRTLPPAAVRMLADELAASGGLLIVDEAFVDFTPAVSVASMLPHPALVILRSFGKSYGLAGVRLGFALAAPDRAERLRSAMGPWAVSGPAIAIGQQAVRDAGWRLAAAERLAADAARLDGLLCEAQMGIVGGTILFRLAESDRAAAIGDHLGRAGIMVRRFKAHPTWLRFGIPSEGQFQRLGEALGHFVP